MPVTKKQIRDANNAIVEANKVLEEARQDERVRARELFIKWFEKQTGKTLCIGALFKLNAKAFVRLHNPRGAKHEAPGLFLYQVTSFADDEFHWVGSGWCIMAEVTNRRRETDADVIMLTFNDLKRSQLWKE